MGLSSEDSCHKTVKAAIMRLASGFTCDPKPYKIVGPDPFIRG